MIRIEQTPVRRTPIYNIVARQGDSLKANKAWKQALYCLTPAAIFTSGGLISGPFLPFLADKIVERQLGSASAVELITALRQEGLVAEAEAELPPALCLGHVYEAMVKEQERMLTLVGEAAGLKIELKQVRIRNEVLAKLDDSLSFDPQDNRVLIISSIQRLLNISGGLAYTVRADHAWKIQHKTNPKENSRFEEWRQAEGGSEKDFINQLLFDLPRSDLPSEKRAGIMAQIEAGSCELFIRENWGYFYIPNREKCTFVDPRQIAVDVGGDVSQHRIAFGDSARGEDFYFFLKNTREQTIEVFLLHNWLTNRPLFRNKEKDLATLRGFAHSWSKAMELVAAHHELAQKNEQLELLSVTDPLTGLHNRRYFDDKILTEIRRLRALREPRHLGLLTIDIDNFKGINDSCTHPGGDQVLREVAAIITKSVRQEVDFISRAGTGSDEFMVIMPETDENGIAVVAQRIRAAVETDLHRFNYDGNVVEVTVSIGGSIYLPPRSDNRTARRLTPVPEEIQQEVTALIRRADKALYEAKNKLGRNKIAVMLSNNSWLDLSGVL
jgi:diguanylate cyclase (GGDEF)-like protein